MSKRLRLENERVAAIKDEEREEEDKLKLIKERIYAPITWKRMAIGIRIMDIKEDRFQDVLNFISSYYIPEDVLCRNTEMDMDRVSEQSFLDQCLYFLKDTSSIMAIDESSIQESRDSWILIASIQVSYMEIFNLMWLSRLTGSTTASARGRETRVCAGENEIVGVLLMRLILKEDYGRVFARTIMLDGRAQKKCMQIKIALNRKVDIFADFDCESYLSIEAVSVKPSHRKKGIGFNMLRCTPEIARSLRVTVISGIFDNYALQRCARKIGMEVVCEINYVEWRDKEKNLVFDDPGPGNYTCAFMAGKVPAEEPPEPTKPVEKKVVEEKKQKTTRKEKREIAMKKNK